MDAPGLNHPGASQRSNPVQGGPATNPPADTTPLPRLAFSTAEAAQMLGISERSIRRLIARGLLRPSRALRHMLIPRTEIERFLEETAP